MTIFFFLIPLLTLLSAVSLYRYQGKREFLRFDFLQFVYAFVCVPVLFVWFKSFIFFLLRHEVEAALSSSELFVIDTMLSVAMLYVAFFVVIHSLTKSFRLKLHKDPLHNLFLHSEYFHLWLSHLVMFVGGMLLLAGIAAANAIVPLPLFLTKQVFYSLLGASVVMGALMYVGLRLSDPQQGNFMRLMKLSLGVCFLLLAAVYFWIDPPFRGEYAMFWMALISFVSAVTFALFGDRSRRTTAILTKMQHRGWGGNIHVLAKK